jgi:DNA-binding transcriptional LysR family regulator
MDLDGIALFVETVKQGSITAAAKALEKPKSTVSRQLSEFEDRMGVKLMQRSTRSLHLTEAGEALYSQARSLVEELGDIQQSVGAYQRKPKGQLKILWPQELFTEQMGELISEFLQSWPDIQLLGAQYTGNTPAPENQYDLQFVLHQQALPASDWIARSLLSIPQDVYVASHCLNKAPKTLQGLSSCQCILQTDETEWLFRHQLASHAIPVSGRLTLNSTDMRLQAAIRGLGLVRLPTYLATPYVHSGALQKIIFEEKPVADTLSVIYRSRQLPLKTRLFLEHFQNHIGRLYSQV